MHTAVVITAIFTEMCIRDRILTVQTAEKIGESRLPSGSLHLSHNSQPIFFTAYSSIYPLAPIGSS